MSKRGGCWFCPNAKLAEHKAIRKCNRKAWDRFIALENEENVAHSKWNVYGTTLKEREVQLEKGLGQVDLFDD